MENDVIPRGSASNLLKTYSRKRRRLLAVSPSQLNSRESSHTLVSTSKGLPSAAQSEGEIVNKYLQSNTILPASKRRRSGEHTASSLYPQESVHQQNSSIQVLQSISLPEQTVAGHLEQRSDRVLNNQNPTVLAASSASEDQIVQIHEESRNPLHESQQLLPTKPQSCTQVQVVNKQSLTSQFKRGSIRSFFKPIQPSSPSIPPPTSSSPPRDSLHSEISTPPTSPPSRRQSPELEPNTRRRKRRRLDINSNLISRMSDFKHTDPDIDELLAGSDFADARTLNGDSPMGVKPQSKTDEEELMFMMEEDLENANKGKNIATSSLFTPERKHSDIASLYHGHGSDSYRISSPLPSDLLPGKPGPSKPLSELAARDNELEDQQDEERRGKPARQVSKSITMVQSKLTMLNSIIECVKCGMAWDKTNAKDVKIHGGHCKDVDSPKQPRVGAVVLRSNTDKKSSIVVIDRTQSKAWRRYAEQVVEICSRQHLEGPLMTAADLWSEVNHKKLGMVPRYKVYVYTVDRVIVGFLLAESIADAGPLYYGPTESEFFDASDASALSEADFPSGTLEFVYLGTPHIVYACVDRIWVRKDWRRQGIATVLADCVRDDFAKQYASPLTKLELAFSYPTSTGRDFATRYFKDRRGGLKNDYYRFICNPIDVQYIRKDRFVTLNESFVSKKQ